jgi:hypothetical protein
MTDPRQDLVSEIRASFERLQIMVADLHPTDEPDPAKAEMIARAQARAGIAPRRDRGARAGVGRTGLDLASSEIEPLDTSVAVRDDAGVGLSS